MHQNRFYVGSFKDAMQGDNPELINQVLDEVMSEDEALLMASNYGSIHVMAFLIAQGADVNYVEADTGDTPLLQAMESDKPEAVQLLLDNGAKLYHKNTFGFSAYDYVADGDCCDEIIAIVHKHVISASISTENSLMEANHAF